jgi:hypothetical protein
VEILCTEPKTGDKTGIVDKLHVTDTWKPSVYGRYARNDKKRYYPSKRYTVVPVTAHCGYDQYKRNRKRPETVENRPLHPVRRQQERVDRNAKSKEEITGDRPTELLRKRAPHTGKNDNPQEKAGGKPRQNHRYHHHGHYFGCLYVYAIFFLYHIPPSARFRFPIPFFRRNLSATMLFRYIISYPPFDFNRAIRIPETTTSDFGIIVSKYQ